MIQVAKYALEVIMQMSFDLAFSGVRREFSGKKRVLRSAGHYLAYNTRCAWLESCCLGAPLLPRFLILDDAGVCDAVLGSFGSSWSCSMILFLFLRLLTGKIRRSKYLNQWKTDWWSQPKDHLLRFDQVATKRLDRVPLLCLGLSVVQCVTCNAPVEYHNNLPHANKRAVCCSLRVVVLLEQNRKPVVNFPLLWLPLKHKQLSKITCSLKKKKAEKICSQQKLNKCSNLCGSSRTNGGGRNLRQHCRKCHRHHFRGYLAHREKWSVVRKSYLRIPAKSSLRELEQKWRACWSIGPWPWWRASCALLKPWCY